MKVNYTRRLKAVVNLITTGTIEDIELNVSKQLADFTGNICFGEFFYCTMLKTNGAYSLMKCAICL